MNLRMKIGLTWETDVLNLLRDLGWDAETFGSAMLSERARDIIRLRATWVRWLPDIVATTPGGPLLFIDAKNSSAEDTGNHAVEDAASEVAQRTTNVAGNVFALYAFWHPQNRAGFVRADVWQAHARVGSFAGRGSGTPFHVAPCQGLCASIHRAIEGVPA